MTRVAQAGAIAVRGSNAEPEVLIVRAKRNPRDWIFPKGHVEAGETLEETAVRELAEEAGVAGTVVRRVGASTFQLSDSVIEVTYFLVRFVGTVARTETREIKWCSFETAQSLLTFDDARRLLNDAERLLAGRR